MLSKASTLGRHDVNKQEESATCALIGCFLQAKSHLMCDWLIFL